MGTMNNFFEGSEKLLEIWFKPTNDNCNLRRIPLNDITNILDNVNCQIVSSLSNDFIDSYLLSESSLFISKKRIILKTCGTTYLLNACKPLIACAGKLGFYEYQIFYSRRRYICPESQPELHRNFKREVEYFDKEIKACGSAYTFGRINGDCWNLYMSYNSKLIDDNDSTFEMIMSELDPVKMLAFYKSKEIMDGNDATNVSGICNLYKDALIDDYLFEPCGYSSNGLIYEDKYFNIHVTPEDGFSYASFETNLPERNLWRLIKQLLNIFGPKKFFMTLITEEDSQSSENHLLINREVRLLLNGNGFQRKDWQMGTIGNVDVTYTYFVYEDS